MRMFYKIGNCTNPELNAGFVCFVSALVATEQVPNMYQRRYDCTEKKDAHGGNEKYRISLVVLR